MGAPWRAFQSRSNSFIMIVPRPTCLGGGCVWVHCDPCVLEKLVLEKSRLRRTLPSSLTSSDTFSFFTVSYIVPVHPRNGRKSRAQPGTPSKKRSPCLDFREKHCFPCMYARRDTVTSKNPAIGYFGQLLGNAPGGATNLSWCVTRGSQSKPPRY